MTSLLLLSLLAAHPDRAVLERTVRDRFEAVGRSMPPIDSALSAAADSLAQRALEHGVEDAASLINVTTAISRQRAWDPNPVVIALRASTERLRDELEKQDLGSEPSTHLGFGVAFGKERSAIIILLARRRIELDPFERSFKKPVANKLLCGELRAPLTSAELFVTRPNGAVEREPMPITRGKVCAGLDFTMNGRHSVEVLATGPRGPEVAALFFVDVGTVSAEADEAIAEPSDAKTTRAVLLTRINALRLQMGATAVQGDAALDDVAQRWAERLAHENFFSHVAPDGSTLKQRLQDAGYVFSAAGENLGLSSGPLAAHFGIEHSPGHRNNLLEAPHRKLGIGLARRSDGLQVLVEVLAAPGPVEVADPQAALYGSITAARKKLGLPVLQKNPLLEGLALDHVRRALQAQVPRAQIPGQPKLHDRAFELVDSLKAVSVDVLIADSPGVVDSKNLQARDTTQVGAATVKGDSEKYGNGRYWIVVIYGATAP